MENAFIASPRTPNGVTILLNVFLELGIKVFRTGRGQFWMSRGDREIVTDHEFADLVKHLPVFRKTREFQFTENLAIEWGHLVDFERLQDHHVVLMTRDPRDALFSWWRRMKSANFSAYGQTEAPATFLEYIQRRSEYFPNAENLNRIDDHGAYYRKILSYADKFKSFYIIRFEDVKAASFASIVALLAHLRVKRPLQAVLQAIEASDLTVAKEVEQLVAQTPQLAAANPFVVNFRGKVFEWEENRAEAQAYKLIADKTADLCRVFGYRVEKRPAAADGKIARPAGEVPLKLHIGGQIRAEGWKILNIQPGPEVDYVGNCTDLSGFADNSVQTIYASHVLEHVSHAEILPTLKEWHRVLVPGGQVMISVPDIEIMSKLLTHPQATLALKADLMLLTYGGQRDAYDFHKTGFTVDILAAYLQAAGFKNLQRVQEFGLFNDYSAYRIAGNPISLNVTGQKEPMPG